MNSLNENDVVEAVCAFLEASGFEISQRLLTTQRGEDIIASYPGPPRVSLSIEAKGATSARKDSNRYGLPFTSAQIRVHVAEAVFKSIQILARESSDSCLAGIALPSTKRHRALMDPVQPFLQDLGVRVFWVGEDKDVTVSGEWDWTFNSA